tara:strand:+ start:349 stop:534 length:186 start_codon:yes stop_codon:yes gene_type:complete
MYDFAPPLPALNALTMIFIMVPDKDWATARKNRQKNVVFYVSMEAEHYHTHMSICLGEKKM